MATDGPTTVPCDVQLLTPADSLYLAAVHMALDAPPPTDPDNPDPKVARLLDPTPGDEPKLDLVAAGIDRGRLVTATVALVSPGRAALVSVSRCGPQDVIAATLQTQARAAWQQGLRLLEILVVPGTPADQAVLQAADYRPLTTLVYLRGRADAVPRRPTTNELEWRSYTPQTAGIFERAIERSYEQSLDCPELSELRTVQDALAGHRAAGTFDSSLWWVAILNGEPVGVILLSRLPSQTGLELVYMGTAPAARGRGVGDALLERGFHCAAAAGATRVALAVDARNTHARRLYKRWGFAEVGVRDAWIASPSES